MADKVLRSITFPGLEDRYTIPDHSVEIEQIKEDLSSFEDDLSSFEDATIAKDTAIDIGNLVSGSTINAKTGGNVAVAYGTRTNYIDFSVPALLEFNFDLSVYQYVIFTYSMHSTSSVSGNPTKAVFATDKRIIVLVPAGTAPCLRIGITRVDRQTMTTDISNPESDFYKIKNGISSYRFTDETLSRNGVSADALATGNALAGKVSKTDINIDAVNAAISLQSVIPVRPAETFTSNGITVKSDGNGTYKISGTATSNAAYNLYYDESSLPANIKTGIRYRVKVSIPSLYTQFRVIYYKDGAWTAALSTGSDGYFAIPDGAIGFGVRLFCYANGLNSPEFSIHPDIYPVDSLGNINSKNTASMFPPMLTIIDDDGYGYFYRDLMPLCVAKNAPISSAVVTGYVGVYEGFMTWEQVQECYAAGCEILSHGYNHKTDADILADGNSAEEIEQWYRMAKHDLQLHGIKSDFLVFNNNTANVIQCQQAARRVYKGAIHAAGYVINTPDANPYYIRRFNFTSNSGGTPHTLQEMLDNIDTLVTAGTGWDVWMIHTSSTGGWSSDEVDKLGQVIDYAREHGVLVTTVEHAMRVYYGI